MARIEELEDRLRRIRNFLKSVNLTAETLKVDPQLIAIAFCFCLLFEALEKIGNDAGGVRSNLGNLRDKWLHKDGDR